MWFCENQFQVDSTHNQTHWLLHMHMHMPLCTAIPPYVHYVGTSCEIKKKPDVISCIGFMYIFLSTNKIPVFRRKLFAIIRDKAPELLSKYRCQRGNHSFSQPLASGKNLKVLLKVELWAQSEIAERAVW